MLSPQHDVCNRNLSGIGYACALARSDSTEQLLDQGQFVTDQSGQQKMTANVFTPSPPEGAPAAD